MEQVAGAGVIMELLGAGIMEHSGTKTGASALSRNVGARVAGAAAGGEGTEPARGDMGRGHAWAVGGNDGGDNPGGGVDVVESC